MNVWVERIVGAENAPMAFWAIVALAALVVSYLLYALLKRFRSGTFVAGGRNRKTRLAIMDATAVDTHRRLVLVRRDDVEHLILIGGHSDIVVERDIRVHGAARRPTMVGEEPHAAPSRPQPPRVEAVANAPSAPQPHHAPHREPASTVRSVAQRPTAQPQPRPTVSVSPPPARTPDELDSDLLKELETALDTDDAPAPPQPAKPKSSLDEEMAKLLGELSSQKR